MPGGDGPDLQGRKLIQDLTEDLGWLEEHTRARPQRQERASQLRLAAALVRNCIGPFLDGAPPSPLYVAVVGGAGTGKSTLVNFLVGAAVAEANPQAGFTRHPIAYADSAGPPPWTRHLGVLGPLRRIFEPQPSSLDQDVYQIRTVSGGDRELLRHFIIWDCPDMTTWAASGYVTRLLEVIALADLVVYVASDERYNDEVPTQFLQLILQSGKVVIACLTKMHAEQSAAMLDMFRREVIARIPECTRVAACVAVPHMSMEELADPAGRGERFRRPVVEQALWWAQRAEETRRSTVRGAADYLLRFQEHLMAAARDDLGALKVWGDLVLHGRLEFESRYIREYLSGEKFPRFNEALVRLLQLLELPGIGQYLSKALWLVRTPYRLLKNVFHRFAGGSETPSIPEEPVLRGALTGWLDMLRKEAARREDSHPLWDYIERGFQGGLTQQAQQEFQRCLREFQAGLNEEVEATARAIYQELEKRPLALNTLRSGKFALEAASIGATLAAGGLNLWDVVLVPLVASLTQELVEFLGKQYVDMQREQARQRQRDLFVRCQAAPLAEWLTRWPATGGSSYERLQQVLRRVPQATQELRTLVHSRLGEMKE